MSQPHIPNGADRPIDLFAPEAALEVMLQSHLDAVAAIRPVLGAISQAAALLAKALGGGACVHYAAAGSSGLMALADACELPGTFGVAQSQIRVSMAGGVPADGYMPGHTEDSEADAIDAAQNLRPGDVVVIVSASGTTPFALAFADAARHAGASCIAIANVAGSALLQKADVAIAVTTAPEVIAGSTRLGAGTAQKVALNMISSQAGILLGHVHDGMMINLKPENIKLRRRAADIVRRISDVAEAEAARALEAADYDVKLAILLATGRDAGAARSLLDKYDQRLRPCLDEAEV